MSAADELEKIGDWLQDIYVQEDASEVDKRINALYRIAAEVEALVEACRPIEEAFRKQAYLPVGKPEFLDHDMKIRRRHLNAMRKARSRLAEEEE